MGGGEIVEWSDNSPEERVRVVVKLEGWVRKKILANFGRYLFLVLIEL